jgi:hypothetical protein
MNKNLILFTVLILGVGTGVLIYFNNFEKTSDSKTEAEPVSSTKVQYAKKEPVSSEKINEPSKDDSSKTVPVPEPEEGRLGGSFVSKYSGSSLVFNFEVKQSNSPDFGKIVLMDMSSCNPNAVILGAHYFVKTTYSAERGMYICSEAAELKINGQQ